MKVDGWEPATVGQRALKICDSFECCSNPNRNISIIKKEMETGLIKEKMLIECKSCGCVSTLTLKNIKRGLE